MSDITTLSTAELCEWLDTYAKHVDALGVPGGCGSRLREAARRLDALRWRDASDDLEPGLYLTAQKPVRDHETYGQGLIRVHLDGSVTQFRRGYSADLLSELNEETGAGISHVKRIDETLPTDEPEREVGG